MVLVVEAFQISRWACYLIKERMKQRWVKECSLLPCDELFYWSWCRIFTETFIFLLWLWFILFVKSRVNTLHSLFLLKPALKLAVKQDGNYQSKTWNHKNSSKNLRRLFALAYQFFSCSVGFYCAFSISTFEIIQPIDLGLLVKTHLSVMEH